MWERLLGWIAKYQGLENGACIAFSGGTDSTLALSAVITALGGRAPVEAVYIKTMMYPEGEEDEAGRIAGNLGARFSVLSIDELAQAGISNNPPDRCYRCKRLLFGRLIGYARQRGVQLVLDGSNADDALDYRPGLRALRELGVKSPLLELGFTKSAVRAMCRERGLDVSDKPSSPCLATRIEYNTPLTKEILLQVARAEEYLKSRGFARVRVRRHGELARIEAPPADFQRLLQARDAVCAQFHALGYSYITFDLEGLRSGSMDTGVKRDT